MNKRSIVPRGGALDWGAEGIGHRRRCLRRSRWRRSRVENVVRRIKMDAPQLLAGQTVHRSPRRYLQGDFQKLCAAVHLGRISGELADVALDTGNVLRVVAACQNLIALAGYPNLMNHDLGAR